MKEDRIRRENELREKITREAYIENLDNKPVTDGVIDPEQFFNTTKSRTVFIVQEPYGDKGGWDMPESLRRKNSLHDQPKNGKPTIGAMVKAASKLNDRNEDHNSKAAFENFKETVGYVNIKKEPNAISKSNHSTLKQHANKNKSLLKDQYDNMNLSSKDTVILAGTRQELVEDKGSYFEILGRKFKKNGGVTSIKKGKQEYTKFSNKDGGPAIIATPHPSAARFGKGDYADNIKEVRDCKIPTDVKKEKIYSGGSYSSSSSFMSDIVDTGADICKSSIKCIKENPKTSIVLGAVVVATGAFLIYRMIKKK